MTSVSVRISGAAGDGVESSGAFLAKVASRSGLYVFGHRGYQSVIRGGHVWNQVRIADEKPWSHGEGADILVALNQDSITYQRSHLRDRKAWLKRRTRAGQTWAQRKNASLTYCPAKARTA